MMDIQQYACTHVCSVLSDSATPWTIARQAPLSMGFSSQGYWSALAFSSPGDLPGPEIEPTSLVSPALAGGFFTTGDTWEPYVPLYIYRSPVTYNTKSVS